MVAESFHVKPLIRILQSADRYHVLGLNRQQIKLFEGNRDALDEVELDPAVPRTATEVLGEESKEVHLSVWSSAPGAGVHHVKGLVGYQPLKLAVLVFEQAQTPSVVNLHATKLLLPFGALTDAVATAKFLDGSSGLGFL